MQDQELPIPEFFNPNKVADIWRVSYQELATSARSWADKHTVRSAAQDKNRVGLLLVDVQNTFCIPDFELFVGGMEIANGYDELRDVDELRRVFEQAGASSVSVDTQHGTARFPSVRAMVEADLRGWLPVMGVVLDDDLHLRVGEQAVDDRRVLDDLQVARDQRAAA